MDKAGEDREQESAERVDMDAFLEENMLWRQARNAGDVTKEALAAM